MLVRGNYMVKQQKVNFAGTYEDVPLQRLPLYSSVWDKKQPMTANVQVREVLALEMHVACKPYLKGMMPHPEYTCMLAAVVLV